MMRVNNRKLRSGRRSTSNGTPTLSMKERKGLQPIDAYGTTVEGPTIYADIVPNKKKQHEPNQHAVIYAELAAMPQPTVNTDNSA